MADADFGSESEGEPFNPAPAIDSDNEDIGHDRDHQPRKRRLTEESPPRSKPEVLDEDDEEDEDEREDEPQASRPPKELDDEADEDEDDEDDEDEVTVCLSFLA